MIERTLVLIKPDGVSRHLIGEIIKRFEQRGLKIIGLKMTKSDDQRASKHYNDGIIVALVLEGIDCINVVRKICGSTYPNEASLGSIRGDYAHISKDYANSNNKNVKNLVHASGSLEEAKEEIKIWFNDNELFNYEGDHEKYI